MNLSEIKLQLQAFNQQQNQDFPQQDTLMLIHQRSDFYDNFLLKLWKYFEFDHRDDLTLIAVGGYGRREMFPLSDLDILILIQSSLNEETKQKLNHFITFLWDLNLQVGSTVRTLDECIEIGKQEISIATNMLEGRFLAGNQQAFKQFLERIHQDDFWHINDFLSAKIAEKEQRYSRYHNTSYNLEPDLKHSPGGLRDLHLLMWIMLRHYGVYSLSKLFEQKLLFLEEYEELLNAQNRLFKMRFGLHLQLKRYDNRLRFDLQLQLSEKLGYQGEGNHPVELMMRDYFQATQSISQLSNLLLNNLKKRVLNKTQEKGKQYVLDEHFYIQNNLIFGKDEHYSFFETNPCSILDLFYHLTQYPEARVSILALRHLRLAVKKIDFSLSSLPQAREKFMQLFKQPNCIKRAIKPMHNLGVLTAYLPQWKNINGLMQFNMLHIYTVDEHIIQVMQKLEDLLDKDNQVFPLCSQLFLDTQDRAIIYLSALFHDIAKGRVGDHSEEGAIEVRKFALLHQLPSSQAKLMEFLVAEHLTMSSIAQRRDIYEPNVITEFANIVKNQTALSALLCLTFADMSSTNPDFWNKWKEQLLSQLFNATKLELQKNNEDIMTNKKLGLNNREQAYTELAKEFDAENLNKINHYWDLCPNNYFIRHTKAQLIWHIQSYLSTDLQLPLILVSDKEAQHIVDVFIHCEDRSSLFLMIVKRLTKMKMTILEAQILTNNQWVFDSFVVAENNGKLISKARCEQLQKELTKILKNPEDNIVNNYIKKPIKHRSFKYKTEVKFLENLQQDQTAFEFKTLDREGLLAQISEIFSQLNLQLLNAKITTIGEKVEDFFVISNAENKALTEVQKQQLLERLLNEF